jgi:HNH endonuclease
MPKPTTKARARRYTDQTLKVLFAFCGNQCAHPECTQPIIQNASAASPDLVVGHIAHIYAHSDKGPRGRPGMNGRERNQPDNLILLCPTHHVIVDGQHETYPATMLQEWKRKHERPYRDAMRARLTDLGYVELESAARALLATVKNPVSNYVVIPPADKIAKNKLGDTSNMLLCWARRSRKRLRTRCSKLLNWRAHSPTGSAADFRNGIMISLPRA